MSEPQFIPSGLPHSVEMPEGSSVARSRSGTAGTDIRRTEQDRFASDQVIAVEAHHIVLKASATEAQGTFKISRRDQIERASTIQKAPSVAETPASTGKPVYDQEMVEMNFPARLIQLKIDNDNVREQLQVLETLLLDEQ